jgi:hypothetical protein
MPVLVGLQQFVPHRGLARGIQTQLRNPARFIHATVGRNLKSHHLQLFGLIKKEGILTTFLLLLPWRESNPLLNRLDTITLSTIKLSGHMFYFSYAMIFQ